MSKWYRTGVVNLTVGDKRVTGVATYWLTAANRPESGDIFVIDNKLYEILSVDLDGSLTLDRAYEAPGTELLGALIYGVSYAIIRNTSATLNTRIAAQVSDVLSKLGDRVTVSTASPTAGQGNDGDIWIVPASPVI